MADKVSKFIFPVKTGNTIADKEFEIPGGSSFDGDYNSLTNKPTLGTASAKDVPSSGNASSSQVVMGNDSRLTDSRNAKDVPSWAKASSKPTYTASEVGAIATSAKGTANGVAELDSSGKVPSSQLPSYVDDVLEYDNQSVFPSTGETGKIYVAKDTNKSYRWTGSAYSQIKGDLALGETSSTAYRGDRGKTAYDHSQSTHARTDATKTEASSTNGNIKINGTETNVYTHPGSGTNPHGTTKSDVGLSNVGNFKAVSTVASQGLSNAEKSNARANIGAGTSSLALGTTSSTAAKGDHNHDERYYTEDEENDIIDGLQAATGIVQEQVSNSGDVYSEKDYAVGDLCIHNNVLYRCTTACSAGSWIANQSCFTPDTLVKALNRAAKYGTFSINIKASDFTQFGSLYSHIYTLNLSLPSGTSAVFITSLGNDFWVTRAFIVSNVLQSMRIVRATALSTDSTIELQYICI